MISIAAFTDEGIVYEKNDDKILIDTDIIENGLFEKEVDAECLAVICDGMGGENLGNEAALIALKTFQGDQSDLLKGEKIEYLIKEANINILMAQNIGKEYQRMGTTIAGVFVKNGSYLMFNVGDSRVYRFRRSRLYQLSKDHSLVQELIDVNMITDEEAKNHPKKNIINRFLGNKTDYEPEIKLMTEAILPNDILFICSDGITDVLENKDLKDMLLMIKSKGDLGSVCREIVQKAKNHGSQDNLSIVLLLLS